MSKYLEIVNNDNKFIVSDVASDYVLEDIIHISELGDYDTNDETKAGIVNRNGYYDNYHDSSTYHSIYKYPFCACLGTKNAGKLCVLYNASTVEIPAQIFQSGSACVRTHIQGARATDSIDIGGATNWKIAWSAGNDAYYVLLKNTYNTWETPFALLPTCFGSATQPFVSWAEKTTTLELAKNLYVFVFGKEKKTAPNGVGMYFCDANSKIVWSSSSYPIEIMGSIHTDSSSSTASKTSYNKKVGFVTVNRGMMPYISNTSFSTIDCSPYYDFNNFKNNNGYGSWSYIYIRGWRNELGDWSLIDNGADYIVVDLSKICNKYNL